ncbi:MAG: metallophosphoesterase [Chakrabartia sp.]
MHASPTAFSNNMTVRRIIFSIFLVGLIGLGWGYWAATRDPLVRTATVHIADWPKGTPPIKALLISDIHISGPDMPPSRMVAIAKKLNGYKADIVLIAGDLISEKRVSTHIYSVPEVIAPLKEFRAPLGVVIAMGNHDHWFDEAGFRAEIPKAGITLLTNEAVKRGPIVIGGVDDDFTNHADLPKAYAAMDQLSGPRIILTHSPDIVPDLPKPVAAVLAGHTHCGQALWPWSGKPVKNASRYGSRFQCGDINDAGQRVLVTAGLGTSIIWLRYGAPPDAWLITFGP